MPLPLLPIAFQAGTGLLGGLFGGMQSNRQNRLMREYRAKLMQIASPEYFRNLQQSLYNQSLAGPAYAAGQRGIFNAGANITNRLQGSLAARGLSNSGVGSIAPALAASSTAGQLGNLRTGLYGQAGSQAQAQQANLLAALQAMGPEQNYNYGAQALGGSLADIGKYITDYYPSPYKKTP